MRVLNMVCCLVLCLGSFGFAFGSVQTEDVLVDGRGRTVDEAVINGLQEAIRQKRGVEIEALRWVRSSLEDVYRQEGTEEFSSTEISEEVMDKIRTHTQGLIERYNILDRNELPDGRWEVKIRAFVPVYRPRVESQRSTLAVMPIVAQQGLQADHGLDVDEVARQITRRLTTQLVQTRHYRILDREYGDEFEKERQFIFSGNVPIREMARLEEQLGADYLLIGTLSDVHSSVTSQEVRGIDVIRYRVVLSIDLRAVEFATRQVHRADSITVSLDRVADLRSPADRSRHREMNEEIPDRLIIELVDDISTKLNRGFLDILMPIRVLDIQDGRVYLNQGGSRIDREERFFILGPHRYVRDPGSGVRIRIDDERLAKIIVSDAMEDYSVANILEGEEEGIASGLRCKRIP